MTTTLFNQVNKALDYKLTNSKLLAALALHDTDMNATQLAETILVSKAAVTSIIDKLEALHMVERRRSLKDRRSATIRMTDHGRSVVEDILNHEPLEDDA